MIPWEGLFAYLLILVWAALLGWLPFRLLEYVSIVDQIDAGDVERGGAAHGSGTRCSKCGTVNEGRYSYCGSCGARLPAGR